MKENENETVLNVLSDIRNFMLSRKNVLTVRELSAYTGLSTSAIYKLTFERQIPHFKPGGKLIFFRRTDIDAWLLTNPIETVDDKMRELNKKISEQIKIPRT
jgi:excisionase family DNA binding protein